MANARSNPFDFDVTKMFADFRFRPFDVEAAWAAQRRNIEALSQANQVAVEGVQAFAQRQFELTREAFEGLSVLLRDLAQPVSPEDRIAKNTEYAKQMLEKGVTHGREIAALATKTGTEAAAVLHRRASESLDEIRAFASQTNGR
jgi:phasin family protein